jgi:hypothetical protein
MTIMMKHLLLVIVGSLVALGSLAQGQEQAKNDSTSVMWVIDGIILEPDIPVTASDLIEDSIPSLLQTQFPILKLLDIQDIHVIDDFPRLCNTKIDHIVTITTRDGSGIKDLELNGVYTTKKKKIPLGCFVNEGWILRLIEKDWKIKADRITDLQFHPDGKIVLDKKGRPHQIFITITTE